MRFTHNTLNLLTREQSVNLLNMQLAAAIDLQGQIKQAHWNVRGPGFIAVHELFDRAASLVGEHADLLAERCGALGGTAQGTIQTAAAHSVLVPYPLMIADTQKHIFAVSAALAAFGQSVRTTIELVTTQGDPDTADLLTQISRGIDAMLWLVESHAQVNERTEQT
jgi:starvation-inducible DNA-binding protein